MKGFKVSRGMFSLIGLITATQIACASAQVSSQELAISDFLPVGNAQWSVSGDEITASKGNGFLVSKEQYNDYYLKLEFYAGSGTNSGIFIRCEDSANITDKNCYEANIFDSRPDPTYRTGAITGHAHPKVILNSEDGNWHSYELYVVGDQVRVLLNGKETVFMRDQRHRSGHIALQLAQGSIKFRNLEIKPVSSHTHKPKKTVLDGVWELESFNFLDKSGNATPWCVGSYGVIIYTENYMSTAINCTSDSTKVLLYSGPFHIENQTVFHHAQNFSNSTLNKVFSRSFQMKDKNHLELSGDLGEGKVIVTWVRR